VTAPAADEKSKEGRFQVASNKGSKKNGVTSSTAAPAVHTATTVTMLSFANPPLSDDAGAVASDCAKQGFAVIGIKIGGPTDVIDFGRFDKQSCIDLANAIEICVDSKGFEVPSLAGTFDVMREHGTQITFANFVKALSKIMKPKA
jgi:hypothetical protein